MYLGVCVIAIKGKGHERGHVWEGLEGKKKRGK